MTNEDILNTNDYELMMLYHENDENAKNIIYLKYKFIIDIVIKKYQKYLISLNVDKQEIDSDCALGFSDALKSFQEDRTTSLPTFITLCVERRMHTLIRKYTRDKHKIEQESFSLDFVYDTDNKLMDFVSDLEYEPLKNMTDYEEYKELVNNIRNELTKKEYDVFVLLIRNIPYIEIAKILNLTPKQVDNTIQRIKTKVREIKNKIN